MSSDSPASNLASSGEWFHRYGDRMVLYARQYLPADAAEDVVQDVFVKLIALRHRPEQVQAWLFTAVRHAAVSRWRKESRRRQREQRAAQTNPAWFTGRPEDSIDARTAQDALADLPIEQREVVVLRLWGELTLAQIARIVGVSTTTIFRRYQEALQTMQERMGQPCHTMKT